MDIKEHAAHLAAMVTPKEISGYRRILADNTNYLTVELQRFADSSLASLRERIACMVAHPMESFTEPMELADAIRRFPLRADQAA